jgi:vesicle-fusing ATPase
MAIRLQLNVEAFGRDEQSQAGSNLVYVSPATFGKITNPDKLVKINGFLFCADSSPKVKEDKIRLNGFQRRQLQCPLDAPLDLVVVGNSGDLVVASEVTMEMSFSSPGKKDKLLLDADQLREAWKVSMRRVPFNAKEQFAFNFNSEQYICQVTELKGVKIGGGGTQIPVEKCLTAVFSVNITRCFFKKSQNSTIVIEDNSAGSTATSIFQPNFSFEDLDIGGLDEEFEIIFRTAFTSRLFPPRMIRDRGIKHVKGILLFGPPGTGKTLMARQIGKMLNTVEPKIVNGPEVLDKYVGSSEAKVRELFEDARKDQQENGENSQLHLIIFDELDSICKKRGTVTGAAGVADTVVNQLLSMIDGVNALDNVLLIGMTNRLDLIDEAVIRPGRLEVQIELGLPNEHGRKQIFHIHTKRLAKVGALADDVDLQELAELTPNYTGAEIEGVVKSAHAFAMRAAIDPDTKMPRPDANVVVTREYFTMALQQVRPAFGIEENLLEMYVPMGVVEFSDEFKATRRKVAQSVDALLKSEHFSLMTFCIHGRPGTGLTSFAVKMASDGFRYLKVMTVKQFIGRSEDRVCSEILDIFENAYRSPESAIVIDNVNAIIEYSKVGPRFSNRILQSITALLTILPPKGHKLAVFVTTSKRDEMQIIGLERQYFSLEVELKPMKTLDEILTVGKEAMGLDVQFSGDEKAEAERLFGTDGRNTAPVKRAIDAFKHAVHEAKGEPVCWGAFKSILTNLLPEGQDLEPVLPF